MFTNPFRSSNKDPFSDLESNSNSAQTNDTETSLFQDQDIVEHTNENPGTHFVHPHHVDGYERSDGTHVDGYWRDGDHDTSHDRTVEDGGGYEQTNPDDSLDNNFDV